MFKGVLCKLHWVTVIEGAALLTIPARWCWAVHRCWSAHRNCCEKKDSELQQTNCRLRVIAAVFLHYVNVTRCNIKKSQGYELHSRSCIGAGAAETAMSSEARDSDIRRRESTAVIIGSNGISNLPSTVEPKMKNLSSVTHWSKPVWFLSSVEN